jgi:TonB family protein
MMVLMRQVGLAITLFSAFFAVGLGQCLAQGPAEAPRKILLKTQAVYPTLARSMNIQGVAKLEAQVARDGSVKAIVVKGGHPLLTQSAVTAVGHWKFEPASHETKEQVEVRFDLQ